MPIKNAESMRIRVEEAELANYALFNLLADIRKAAGDPTGKLMQDELDAAIDRSRAAK